MTNNQVLISRIKIQMKANRLARRYLQEQGAGGNSTWQQLAGEYRLLRAELSVAQLPTI